MGSSIATARRIKTICKGTKDHYVLLSDSTFDALFEHNNIQKENKCHMAYIYPDWYIKRNNSFLIKLCATAKFK